MEWNDENMKKWILDYHSNKGAVESLLYLKGHDDTSKELLIKARYTNYIYIIIIIAFYILL